MGQPNALGGVAQVIQKRLAHGSKNGQDRNNLKSGPDRTKEPRMAKKYVFFDSKTGQRVFEWGGHQPQIKVSCANIRPQIHNVDIYDLGL